MERYKYFIFGYLWIVLVILQQDVLVMAGEEILFISATSTVEPYTRIPVKVDTTRIYDTTQRHVFHTHRHHQIPAHRAKTIRPFHRNKVTAPPKRVPTPKVLIPTTQPPKTTKQIIIPPKIPQTTKRVPDVTGPPTYNTTDNSLLPTTTTHAAGVGSNGVRVIYHCSFELNEKCHFHQDSRDELDWLIERDPNPWTTSNGEDQDSGQDSRESQEIGPAQLLKKTPSGKHNFDMSFGRFAHLTPRKALHKPGPIGGRARIATPYIEAPEGYVDLSFLYHIFNAHPELVEGILNVFACQKQLVWSSSASWGNNWFKADIKITCNERFRIYFEGVIGGVDIDIAIDDVSVTGPQKPKTIPTTKLILITTDRFTTEEYENTTTPTPSVETPIMSPGNDTDPRTKIDPGTAVSLVAVSVGLFILTVVMLLVSLVVHARVCSKRNKYPAHIIYHGPEYFNRGTDGEQTAYMTLNFRDGLSSSHSAGTGTGTETLTLSDRQSGPTPIDRSSWEQVIMRDMRDMKPVRRESKTFPIMKEIKHLLEAVHMRRIRTLSAHLTRAEVETMRRQFTPDTTQDTQDTTQDSGTQEHDRTRSTVALERTGSSIRPLSEISEHFYYSLFPDPRTRPDRVRPDSGLSGLSQFNNGFENDAGSRPTSHKTARRSVSRPLSSPNTTPPRTASQSRPRKDSPKGSDSSSPEISRGTNGSKKKEQLYVKARPRAKSPPVDDIEIIDETKEEEPVEKVNGEHSASDKEETGSLAPETTEMVENEIYEPYSGDVESDT